MEAAAAYFTRRARQERTSAAEAGSAEARSAHLELALRLVRVATESPLWSGWSEEAGPVAHGQDQDVLNDVAVALDDAFPLPGAGAFDELLDAADKGRS